MQSIQPYSRILHSVPQPQSDAPIGIFDSGIGGITVALEVIKHLPNERILYYADTANVPYGNKSDEDIRNLTAKAIEWLYQQGCKVAIVACNTASAFSLDFLRAHYGAQFPIIGLVPAVKPAVIQSKSKVVGVLATPATFRGKLIQEVITHFAQPAGVQVLSMTCAALVPLIENGQAASSETMDALQQVLQPLVDKGADHLVLGCTHYPILRPAIQQLYANRLVMVDSGPAVARQCGRILANHALLATQHNRSAQLLCVFSANNCDKMGIVLKSMFKNINNFVFINLSKYAKK